MMSSLASCLDGPSLQQVVDLRAPPDAEERIEWLAERANEGELTPEEASEYESFIRFSNFVGILQAEARKRLGQN